MSFLGKSGADAVFVALNHICKVVNRYHVKLDAAIDQAATDGVIGSGEATAAHAFIDAASITCEIFKLVSGNSGF